MQWLLISISDVSGTPYINYDPIHVTKPIIPKNNISDDLKSILDNFDFNKNLYLPSLVTYPVFQTLSHIFTYLSKTIKCFSFHFECIRIDVFVVKNRIYTK